MQHVASVLAVVLTFATADSTELRREALMSALRHGGYTVILRHARTDRAFQEERSYVPKERSAQRNLTDDGIRDAALMGVVFRKHGITFAEVISSPMYRTVETAEMAAGTPTTITMALRSIPSTPEQAALIKTPPKPGTNRLLVTHHFVIETHVPGIRPGEIGESEAAVVRHTKDGTVELVGRITLDDWRALANPNGVTSAPATTATAAAQQYPAHGAPSNGAAPGISVEIPDTHAGHLAREYIAAFNSGNSDRMRAYIESYMVPTPARSTDERLASYATFFDQHGPLTVLTVERSASTEIALGMGSKRGHFRLTVKSTDAQPMRAESVTFTFMQGAHP
jgi:phosphohistidine phosphatase SixA